MKKQAKQVASKAWKTLVSPKAVLIFNVVGLALQLLHQVEAYRKGDRKIGFRQGNDED